MSDLARWIAAVVLIGGGITALKIMWNPAKAFMYFLITWPSVWPKIVEMTKAFEGKPNIFDILNELVAQTRSDSGSTLKDDLGWLREAATQASEAALEAKQAVEEVASKAERIAVRAQSNTQLAAEDRIALHRLSFQLEQVGATSDRIEIGVSDAKADLDASHARADGATGPHGAAADAFAQPSSE